MLGVALAILAALPAAGAAAPGQTVCPDGSSGASFPTGTVIKGDLVVPAQGLCYLPGTTVRGDVRAETGAITLTMYDGTVIQGDVKIAGATSVVIQNARVKGELRLTRITDIAQVCCEVRIQGPVRITQSNIVTFFQATARQDVVFNDNATLITYDSLVGGNLTCRRNGDVNLGDVPNTVRGSNRGQCATS